MEFLLDGIRAVTPQQCVMYVVGALLIYLAIKKDYEPSLLLPMGFGAILVNLPMSGVLNQMVAGVGESQGIIQWLFETTIEASEALPLLLMQGDQSLPLWGDAQDQGVDSPDLSYCIRR